MMSTRKASVYTSFRTREIRLATSQRKWNTWIEFEDRKPGYSGRPEKPMRERDLVVRGIMETALQMRLGGFHKEFLMSVFGFYAKREMITLKQGKALVKILEHPRYRLQRAELKALGKWRVPRVSLAAVLPKSSLNPNPKQ